MWSGWKLSGRCLKHMTFLSEVTWLERTRWDSDTLMVLLKETMLLHISLVRVLWKACQPNPTALHHPQEKA